MEEIIVKGLWGRAKVEKSRGPSSAIYAGETAPAEASTTKPSAPSSIDTSHCGISSIHSATSQAIWLANYAPNLK